MKGYTGPLCAHVKRQGNFTNPKKRGIARVAERLSISQEGLCLGRRMAQAEVTTYSHYLGTQIEY